MSALFIGTSGVPSAEFEGGFYPPGFIRPPDYLCYYAEHFNSVELESTFYRMPFKATVEGRARSARKGFTFAVKVSKAITHGKVLASCSAEFNQFVKTMDCLEKSWALLVEFIFIVWMGNPYDRKKKGVIC